MQTARAKFIWTTVARIFFLTNINKQWSMRYDHKRDEYRILAPAPVVIETRRYCIDAIVQELVSVSILGVVDAAVHLVQRDAVLGT